MGRGFSRLDAGVLAELGGVGLPASGTGKDWILEGPACGWWGGLAALQKVIIKRRPPYKSSV